MSTQAADPAARQRPAYQRDASVWVAASAGTGKTTVLTNRVLTLLLGGCAPSRILCLTFTKAAAAEMANRVNDNLSRWVVMPDGKLADELRKLTGKKGVDVVFEHVGADTWNGSLLSMKRGGRLVTCGATSGPSASINLMQLFQQQYRIIGSFGAPLSALGRALDRIAGGVRPVIDTVYPLEQFQAGLQRLESRDVFGKLLVEL